MPTPFQVDDLCLYERLSEIGGAATVDVAACVIQHIDRDRDIYCSAIWCFPAEAADPAQPWQLTRGTGMDECPRWSPDGRQLAFLSNDDDHTQVYLISRDGGERRQLTHFDNNAIAIAWAPDGQSLVVAASVPMKPESLSGPATPVSDGGPEIVWRVPYKLDGMGYTLCAQIHLFRVMAADGATSQLTGGRFDAMAAAWSPDGTSVVHTRSRSGRCAHRADVWRMRADGSDAMQLSSEVSSAQFPVWAPDGSTIVFSGAVRDGDARMRLWRIDCTSWKVSPLGEEEIEIVDGQAVFWDEDSRGVFFIAARCGIQEVGYIAVPSGQYRTVVGGWRHVSALSMVAGGYLVYVTESPAEPCQLYRCRRDGSDLVKLSSLNGWWYERVLPEVALRQFQVPDGSGGEETVDGWVISPPRDPARPKSPGPLLIDVHGGPAAYAMLPYNSQTYWNALVSLGWTVLAVNAVGSGSYGRDFADRLRRRWGDLDLAQHIAAAECLVREGQADGRLAIAGKSYGGYLAAWAVATTSRFRAAVISAPITNLETHFGTSDSGYYSDAFDMDGSPEDSRDAYVAPSPAHMAARARTPMLILQGKDDQRCPLGQAEDFFVRVMSLGQAPAEMVLYPGGSHKFFQTGKPSFRADAAQRLVNWLQHWIDVPVSDDGTPR